MIKNLMYRHVSEIEPQISHLDPRQRNHQENSQTKNVGGKLSRRVPRPPPFQVSIEELQPRQHYCVLKLLVGALS